MKLRVFTPYSRPFVLGGKVSGLMACELEVTEPYDCNGVQLHMLVAPNGKTFVVEGFSGGTCGDNLQYVIDDIESADSEVIAKQLQDEKRRGETAETVDEHTFWRWLNCLA